MDLRIQKTLEIIKKEFLLLRKNLPLNKIRVKLICQQAKINKTTFYRYYTDVFDLSDKIESQTISEILSDWKNVDCLFFALEQFIESLFYSLEKHESTIFILFRDRIEIFAEKLEKVLLSLYLKKSATEEDAIKLSFIIGGATHVYLDKKHDYKTDSRVLADLITQISSENSSK